MIENMLAKKRNLKKGEKIPLMYDECYKIMFANEEKLEPLTVLLSRILQVKYEDIEGRITLAPLSIPNKTIGEKKLERDIVVYIRSEDRTKIILEVNVKERFYQTVIDRNLYYMGGISGRVLLESDSYEKIEPTFLINFNTFYVDKTNKHIFDNYYFRNEEGYILTKKQRILNINIVACRGMWYNKEYQYVNNPYEKDLILLCASMVLDKEEDFQNCIEKIEMKGNLKRMMEDVSKEMNGNEELCGRYFDFLEENKRINDSIINEERNKARKEGLKKGLKEGLQQGIQQGLEQGLEQGSLLKQKEVVLNMHKENLSLETISKYSGISINEVKKIINQKNLK